MYRSSIELIKDMCTFFICVAIAEPHCGCIVSSSSSITTTIITIKSRRSSSWVDTSDDHRPLDLVKKSDGVN